MPVDTPIPVDCVIEDDEDDLHQYPALKKSAHATLVLGDLHGNGLKLLHFLLKHGIVYWPEGHNAEALYQEFRDLYSNTNWATPSDTHKANLTRIKQLIGYLNVDPSSPELLFQGDELADRGKSDVINLLLFSLLDKNRISYKCCYSNHTHFFMQTYQSIVGNAYQILPIFVTPQYCSIIPLFIALKEGYISPEELAELVSSHQNHMCLLSHGLGHQELMQHTHAPTSYNITKHLAEKLNLFYLDDTPEHLAWSMERVNHVFLYYLKNGIISTLFNQEAIEALSQSLGIDEHFYPFECIIWNRDYTNLERRQRHPSRKYAMLSAHGHDLNDTLCDQKSIFSLDAFFGKADDLFHSTATNAPNPVLHSNRKRLSASAYATLTVEIKQSITARIQALLTEEQAGDIRAMETAVAHYRILLYDDNFLEIHTLIRQLSVKSYLQKADAVLSDAASLVDLQEQVDSFGTQLGGVPACVLKMLQEPLYEWDIKVEALLQDSKKLFDKSGLFNKLVKAHQKIESSDGECRFLKGSIDSFISLLRSSAPLSYKITIIQKEYTDAIQKAFDSELARISTTVTDGSDIHIRLLQKAFQLLAEVKDILSFAAYDEPHPLQAKFEQAIQEVKCIKQFKTICNDTITQLKRCPKSVIARKLMQHAQSSLTQLESSLSRQENIALIQQFTSEQDQLIQHAIVQLSNAYEQPLTLKDLNLLDRERCALNRVTTIDETRDLLIKHKQQVASIEQTSKEVIQELQTRCQTYSAYLAKKGVADKSVQLTTLQNHLNPVSEINATEALSNFYHAFTACSASLRARRTQKWMDTALNKEVTSALSFFAKKIAHMSQSKGADFVDEIEQYFSEEASFFRKIGCLHEERPALLWYEDEEPGHSVTP